MPQSPLEARFWAKVNKDGPVPIHRPELGPCWVWTAGRSVQGYAKFTKHGRTIGGHRFSYELHKGPVPDGLFVCHLCDNEPCVNPSHLVAETLSWNALDATKKGRMTGLKEALKAHHEGRVNYSRGEHRPLAKMTDAKVIEMRRLHSVEKMTGAQLSKMFGLAQTPTYFILAGKTWKHLLGTAPPATGGAEPSQM